MIKNWNVNFILSSLLFIQLASAFFIETPPPSRDDFYIPPKDYESAEVGTILKYRKTPEKLRSAILPVNVKHSWHLMFRSTDAFGNPTAIVTTVIEPYNADPSKLVSYQSAEDAGSIDCAPSYAFMLGASETTIITNIEMYLIEVMLSEGYYVVTPDYEGPKASFAAGRQAGHATLDSLRATLNSSDITGVDPNAKAVLWGYSGGSFATGWAAALQKTYAKELRPNILGAAVGGWLTNITATAEAVEGTIFAGLAGSGLIGIANEYPEFQKFINEAVYQEKLDSYNEGARLCTLPSLLRYAFNRFFTGPTRFFKDGFSVFQNEIVKKIIDLNTLALYHNEEIPDIPMFIFHGKKDEIVPFKEAQRAYNNWCEWGIESLEFAVSESTGHVTEAIEGSPAAIAWINARFNGKAPVKGCQKTVRLTNQLYPDAHRSVAKMIYFILKTTFGNKVGPNGENFTLAGLRRFLSLRWNDLIS